MKRKVIQAGNSLAVTLPSELLERWNLELGSEVNVELDEEHQGILLTPVEPETTIDPEFDERIRAFIERYRPALESLAKR